MTSVVLYPCLQSQGFPVLSKEEVLIGRLVDTVVDWVVQSEGCDSIQKRFFSGQSPQIVYEEVDIANKTIFV